ncbi:hypothetical protein AX15_002087 [Amanita polypyramis BW_CC]|nr:hypothetical protein AX15_002087 [Amanita polypyramis BW_CC]
METLDSDAPLGELPDNADDTLATLSCILYDANTANVQLARVDLWFLRGVSRFSTSLDPLQAQCQKSTRTHHRIVPISPAIDDSNNVDFIRYHLRSAFDA